MRARPRDWTLSLLLLLERTHAFGQLASVRNRVARAERVLVGALVSDAPEEEEQARRGLLPASARIHAARAEGALVGGEPTAALLAHLSAMISDAPEEEEALLDSYKRLLRLSRRSQTAHTSVALLKHLKQHLQPDAAVIHLATCDAVRRGPCHIPRALDMLAVIHTSDALSTGTFDMVIHAAAKARNRTTAYKAYGVLRRRGLVPTTYTLNALLNVETRCARPDAALRLLRIAECGAPRWPGSPPDGWSYTSAMAAAAASRQHEAVCQLFAKLTNDKRLSGGVVAYNMALESRIRMGDTAGAIKLLRRLTTGTYGMSAPRTDTYNGMLRALGDRGEPYAWVIREMATVTHAHAHAPSPAPTIRIGAVKSTSTLPTRAGSHGGTRQEFISSSSPQVMTSPHDVDSLCVQAGVDPDCITISTLLKLQPTLRSANDVWRWGRRRAVMCDVGAWHHWIECHVRLGAPEKAASLLQRMEVEDGLVCEPDPNPNPCGGTALMLASVSS